MNAEFANIRTEFGITFNIIRDIIKRNPPPLEHMKMFLEDCYPSLNPSLSDVETIDDVLDVVRDKCTLIDINCLMAVVKKFDIKEAEACIKSYERTLEEFCQSISVRLCLEETFPVTTTLSPLICETVTFVLDWDPDGCTLNDIKCLLSVAFEKLCKRVKVIIIKEGN